MTKTNRTLSLILAFLMLFTMLASCGKTGGDGQGGSDIAADAEHAPSDTSEPVNERFLIKEELPDITFGGRDFKILYPTWSMYSDYYFASEAIGEQLNDEIYRRTIDVEEKFDIKIVPVTKGGIDSIIPDVQKTTKAGVDEYSLVLTHCITGVAEFLTGGYGVDWNEVEYADLSKPWWNQRMNEQLAVNGILIPAVSDFIIFDPTVIYFNKRMIRDYGLESPYDLVKSGQWTWTKLNELAKSVSQDLNGDGKFTAADQYGFVTDCGWMFESALQACDMFITEKDGEGYPVVAINNEKFGDIAVMLYDLLYNNNTTYIGAWDPNYSTGTYESQIPLSTDRVLFHTDPLSVGKRYRAYEVDFGILPYPKYDELQKEYLSLSWNGFMFIPNTADIEMAGAVSEMLAAESYRYVIPAYYDVLLTSKLSRDEESVEMIDIIYKGACYELALNFGSFDSLSFPLTNLLKSKSVEYSSYLEKNTKAFELKMRKLIDRATDHYTQ